MNKVLGIVLIMCTGILQAGIVIDEVGTAFNYQGELLVNGSPANGSYDMVFYLFTDGAAGFSLDDVSLNDVNVNNGLFQVELDFGDTYFGGTALWLEIEVSSDTMPAEVLSPRQRLRTTPYAIQASYVTNGSSLWQDLGTAIHYNDEVIVGNQNTTTDSLLTVDTNSAQSPLRVKINGATRMIVRDNGGTSIGINTSAPENGLRVEGDSRLVGNTELKGDLKQDLNNNGAIKAAVTVQCGAPTIIEKYFNGVDSQPIVVGSEPFFQGTCYIEFPFSLSQRYFVATIREIDNVGDNMLCGIHTSNVLKCVTSNVVSLKKDLRIDILIY